LPFFDQKLFLKKSKKCSFLLAKVKEKIKTDKTLSQNSDIQKFSVQKDVSTILILPFLILPFLILLFLILLFLKRKAKNEKKDF
jgi:ATP-dependent Zn protease